MGNGQSVGYDFKDEDGKRRRGSGWVRAITFVGTDEARRVELVNGRLFRVRVKNLFIIPELTK